MELTHIIEAPLWANWQDACKALDITVTAEQQAQLARFYDHLVTANQTTNLTRIIAPEDFLYRHLLDSLALLPLIKDGSRLMDIGTGAGFPAIPLAIVNPTLSVLGVESVGKKTRFLESAKELLKLDNFEIQNTRSEALAHQPAYRTRFDAVTARAVSALPLLLELSLPLLKSGGTLFAMKGLSYESELAAAQNALKVLGGKLCAVKSYEHPRLAGSRLLVIEKTGRTPPEYPRPGGIATKKGL